MKRKIYIILWIITGMITVVDYKACTIFMANDGKHVWVGNNEDEMPSLTYRLWYYPRLRNQYGYMIWTELSSDEKINHLMYKNPQGGMNEYGLLMDYTAINEIPFTRKRNRLDRSEEVITDVLRKCKTVDEAIDYISKFNLVKLTAAQLFVGDAKGDYAVVHGSYIMRRTTRNFALTNYPVSNHYEPCVRRDTALRYLSVEKDYYLKDVVSLLEKTAQTDTHDIVSNYSIAADLRSTRIHLYYKGDFSKPVIISLKKELNKGVHQRDMAAYFL
ncbi:hypothetical protein [Chryseobacterium sp. OSA05B]|uniref:carcinine hydrolase/isopenicillin-N N-acyltransferase family protein n=1 Tax=Chryseobacterium sp. OSA05B TaxID=2862650 RepID=UPI001CBF7518|nr:hypothetical protein [Chryseobacterium sp. OSA05B]